MPNFSICDASMIALRVKDACKWRRYLKILIAATAMLALVGCVQPWVKPYERQNLADPIMSEQHALNAYYMKHVYENREAARGADGGAGGGCGCN